jgi:nitroreductase
MRTSTSVLLRRAIGTTISTASSSTTATTVVAAAKNNHLAAAKEVEEANSRLRTFHQIVHDRTSVKRFASNITIPNAIWKDMLHLTRTAPSGFNLQPTHIILVRCNEIKTALADHAMLGAGNKYRVVDASGIAVFCADLQPSKRIHRIHDLERTHNIREKGYMSVLRVASTFLTGEKRINTNFNLATMAKQTFANALSPSRPMPTMEDVGMWSYKNAGIMAQLYTLSATAHGLSTCMMEGYDTRRVMDILRIPRDRYGVPIMIATGYEYGINNMESVVHANNLKILTEDYEDEENQRCKAPRLEMNELFFGETFGQPLDFLLDENDRNNMTMLKEDAA